MAALNFSYLSPIKTEADKAQSLFNTLGLGYANLSTGKYSPSSSIVTQNQVPTTTQQTLNTVPTQTQQTQPQNVPLESIPTFQEPQYDINPALQGLSQEEAAQQGIFEANVGSIDTSKNEATGRLQSARENQLQNLSEQEATQQRSTEANINEQRRGFSELSQGLQSRFGTGVSTGLGATAILGREVLSNISQARETFSRVQQNIANDKQRIESETTRAIKVLDAQAEADKQEARAILQQALAAIGTRRGALLGAKAEAQQRAYADYRELIAGINARNKQFEQQLYLRQQSQNQTVQQREQANVNNLLEILKEENLAGLINLGNSDVRQTVADATGLPLSAVGTQLTGGTKEKEDEDLITSYLQ